MKRVLNKRSRLDVPAWGLSFLVALIFVPRQATGQFEQSDRPLEERNQTLAEGYSARDKTACGVDDPCPPEESQIQQSHYPMSLDELTDEVSSAKANVDSPARGTICLYYWYSSGCSHCARVKGYLSELKAGKYHKLEIREHNAKQEMDLYNSLLADYEVPELRRGKVPVVYLGDNYCIGDKECFERLESMIRACTSDGCACRTPKQRSALKVGLVGVASLAAVDAVNVCALAVLIILITAVLTKFPEDRKKMVIIAFAFMGGIFSAYFAVGLLIVLGFKSLAGLGSQSISWVYKTVGIIAIFLGVFNLKDFVWYGGGGFKLEVPESWRPRMKGIIEAVISPRGAYTVGLIVSMFLLPCALGPYFVASGLLAGIPLAQALAWLVLYNLVFILPMLIITFMVYGGFAAIKNIEEWRLRNLKTLHLFAGIILCSIGSAIVTGLI